MKKKYLTTGLCCLILFNLYAQITVQSGAVLHVQNGAQVTAQGNITLANGSTLNNHGIIRMGNTSGLTADLTDNTASAYNYGSGSFVFNSTFNQVINTPNIFERIDMDGSSLTFSSNIVSNKWYLVKGVIHTGAFMATTPSTAQLAVEAGAGNTNFINGWFDGRLRRSVTPAIVNNYQFPVGNATRPNVAELNNLTADALNNITYIDAFFGPKAGTDAGLVVTEQGSAYIGIHNGGVWHLIPNAAPTSGKYQLRLYTNGFTGLDNNQFTILRRPEGSTSGAGWSVPTGSSVNPNGGAGRMAADGYALRNNLGGFSEFGIGLLATALPVKLTNFMVRRTTTRFVQVSWQTQTEQNNRGFEVECRTDNETQFALKGTVPSKAINGNSALSIDYSFTDANTYAGISYYRLKQIDLDGRIYYSLIKAVKGETSVNVLIWPNPNEGQFSIRLEGITDQREAQIIDINGRMVQKLTIKGSQPATIRNLAPGTYVLCIPEAFGTGEHFKEKVMVVR
jgi:hypothetical protein